MTPKSPEFAYSERLTKLASNAEFRFSPKTTSFSVRKSGTEWKARAIKFILLVGHMAVGDRVQEADCKHVDEIPKGPKSDSQCHACRSRIGAGSGRTFAKPALQKRHGCRWMQMGFWAKILGRGRVALFRRCRTGAQSAPGVGVR